MGGEPRTILVEGQPKRHALCQLESTEIVTSVAWAKAEESGGWPEQVWLRPASIDRPAYLGGRLRPAQHKKFIGPSQGGSRDPRAKRPSRVWPEDMTLSAGLI